jgi:hypothetical protein
MNIERRCHLQHVGIHISLSGYPLKGAGLFGSAPEAAASIHRKPEATC